MPDSRNVTDFLLEGKDPSRPAFLPPGREYSYGDVGEASRRIAAHLCSRGLLAGDRVILIGENSFFWAAGYLGVLKAGCVCVPLSTSVSARDLSVICESTSANTVLSQDRMAEKYSAQLLGCVVLRESALDQLSSFLPPPKNAEGDDLAALMFTSGSTGAPRGVMVSHANIIANTRSIIESLRLTGDDRIMAVLPFHYCFGTSLLHTHLRAGGSLVIDSRFMYPEVILNRMIETECTGFAGVPSHFQILLRHSSLASRTFPRLRYVQQAGGALAPCFLRQLHDALPAVEICVMYGQTEATARLSCLPAECLQAKLGSIGKGIPGVRLRVLNESGNPVRPGETGEIVASGDNIAKGYWNASQETAATFRNGCLYTGDLATVDEDGFIFISGRSKDFLKCGGKRVSCRAIEEQVLQHTGLLEAAVLGVPDEILGDAVKLFAVPGGPVPADWVVRLRGALKACLPPQLVPREIVCLRSLPKNSAGKVLKDALRAML
jgi:acyl-CoA synthetase (AMP-forming)/AMP-acid ligase II